MKLIEIISTFFEKESITQIEGYDAIYRCVKKSAAGTPYQIIYFDSTNKWTDESFLSHIETIVASEYFEQPGYLQWNYYYYFISAPDIISKYKARKKDVIKDEAYARKEVLTETQLASFLNAQNSVSAISAHELTTDLYSIWVNFLREKKLFFVYNEADYPNYKRAVEDYIEGIEFNDVPDSISTGHSDEPILNRINSLELTTFRKYPAHDGPFVFGDVNLIKGPNASGKTSFFNALELIITGSSTSGPPSQDYNIKIIDGGGHEWAYPIGNVYKERDTHWYKSAMTRGHNLSGNFARFNYYTSDAAFVLKQNNERSQNNLEEIIADIALGREVNRLEERILEFGKRFGDWKDIFIGEEERLNNESAEKNHTLEEIQKEVKDPTTYRDNLITALKDNVWKYAEKQYIPEFLASLEQSIESVENNLNAIQNKSISREELTLLGVRSQIKALQGKQTQISGLREKLLADRREIADQNRIKLQASGLIDHTKELNSYYTHKFFDRINGFDEKLKTVRINLENADNIKKQSATLTNVDFLTKDPTKSRKLSEIESEISGKQKDAKNEISRIKLQIETLEKGVNALTRITAEIKALGNAYLKEDQSALDCPLCNNTFTKHEDLAKAIEKTKDTFSNSEILITQRDTLKGKEKELNELNQQFAVLEQLRPVCLLLENISWDKNSYEDLAKLLAENEAKVISLNEELGELNIVNSQFSTDNISEKRFKELKTKIESELKVTLLDLSTLTKADVLLTGRVHVATTALDRLEGDIGKSEKDYQAIFDSSLPNEEAIALRLTILEGVENSIQQVLLHIDFPDDTNLYTIADRTNLVRSAFSVYKREFESSSSQSQSIGLLKDELQRLSEQLIETQKKKDRTLSAYTELSNLSTEHSKARFLGEYIEKNKGEIVNIFLLIHSPKEFSDIKLENNQIKVIGLDGEPRTLDEISTGQRAALALSIFISLNKKLTNGPNVIFLDDPVAYVDDLNVLSFLDYLRELILKTNRQLFFATANDDLAFLFKKKFEFIGPEKFKTIPLSRID
ncbi:MAG: AAA family ATPase [Chitinophagaceae bacterium]|nr:AAA family ATPase [Chitinophagaceae bacterium]